MTATIALAPTVSPDARDGGGHKRLDIGARHGTGPSASADRPPVRRSAAGVFGTARQGIEEGRPASPAVSARTSVQLASETDGNPDQFARRGPRAVVVASNCCCLGPETEPNPQQFALPGPSCRRAAIAKRPASSGPARKLPPDFGGRAAAQPRARRDSVGVEHRVDVAQLGDRLLEAWVSATSTTKRFWTIGVETMQRASTMLIPASAKVRESSNGGGPTST
jgi:hypothetical protein